MPDNSAKITIDGDAKSYVEEATRSKKATKEVGDEAAKVGKTLEDWTGKLGKAVLGLAAVAKAVAGAAKAGNDAITSAGKASETLGGRALSRGMASARLGLNTNLVNDWTTGSPQSASQLDDFITGLADAKRSNGAGVGTDPAGRAIKLYASGVYDKSEIMDAVEGKRGAKTLDDLEAGAGQRLLDIGAKGQRELALRGQINAINENTEYAKAAPLDFGTFTPTRTITADDARVSEANMARADAEGPGAAILRAGIAKIPLVGGAVKESIDNERMLSNAGIPYWGGESGLTKGIDEQTRLMRDAASKPTTGPGSDFQ
jgi:hypothetical protein